MNALNWNKTNTFDSAFISSKCSDNAAFITKKHQQRKRDIDI
jgi:hypothetical protein